VIVSLDAQDLIPDPYFTVDLPGPIDVPACLEMFRRNGDDLIDRWDGTHLVRTISVNGRSVAYSCTVTGTLERPTLRVIAEDCSSRAQVEAAVRSTFVLPPAEFAGLLTADPVVARLNALFPGVRPVLQHDLLAGIIRCISAQQVNLRWAATTRRRLAEAFGQSHVVDGHTVYSLSPDRLASADPAEIRALQFTSRKAEYIVVAAQAVASGAIGIAGLRELSDEEVVSRLTALRGIGLWTAEWILARTLGRPRVVAGDLGVRKAVGLAYLGAPLPTEQEVRAATAHWEPSAGVAQQLLLHGLSHAVL
jgi:DNA-3-methyladenine glycosylase II